MSTTRHNTNNWMHDLCAFVETTAIIVKIRQIHKLDAWLNVLSAQYDFNLLLKINTNTKSSKKKIVELNFNQKNIFFFTRCSLSRLFESIDFSNWNVLKQTKIKWHLISPHATWSKSNSSSEQLSSICHIIYSGHNLTLDKVNKTCLYYKYTMKTKAHGAGFIHVYVRQKTKHDLWGALIRWTLSTSHPTLWIIFNFFTIKCDMFFNAHRSCNNLLKWKMLWLWMIKDQV